MTLGSRLFRDFLWATVFFAGVVKIYAVSMDTPASVVIDLVTLAGLLAVGGLVAQPSMDYGRGRVVRYAVPAWSRSLSDPVSRVSMVVVIAASLAAGALAAGMLREEPGPVDHSALPPRAVDDLRNVIVINGDGDNDAVVFDHQSHRDMMSSGSGCKKCHHLHMPGDYSTPCHSCHKDTRYPSSIFNHDLHQEKLGGNQSCGQCHNLSMPKGHGNAPSCAKCHQKNMGIKATGKRAFVYMAPSFPEAMRDVCLTCHLRAARNMGLPELAACDCCHKEVHHEAEELEPPKETPPAGAGDDRTDAMFNE
ncbi:MAG TPA: cytochrome c3 family protein [bacterium]|nr:cytochrome c3 family protein [bacterium]